MKKLRELDLQECPLTDDAVGTIASIRSLRRLWLWETAITGDGVRQLKESLPKCQIEWRETRRKPLTRSNRDEVTVEWGMPVQGVQCRLRPEKVTWPLWDASDLTAAPKFEVDIRRAEQPFGYGRLQGDGVHIEWDGKWHKWQKAISPGKDLSIGPRTVLPPLRFSLGKGGVIGEPPFSAAGRVRGIQSTVGKHTVRIAVQLVDGRDLADGPPDISVVSNPVEIEIVAGKPGNAAFGPVTERVVTEQPSKAATYLDLDTGKYATPGPGAVLAHIDWLREHGVDLCLSGAENERTLRTAVDMVIVEYTKDPWHESAGWTPEQARRSVVGNLAERKPSSGHVIIAGFTYAFRTREGSIGIMQLIPPPKDKSEVTVRYKLLKASTAKGEIAPDEPPGGDEQSARAHRADGVVLPVTGVVASLREVKQIPASSDWPHPALRLTVDARNDGEYSLGLPENGLTWQIEIDGRWYEHVPRPGKAASHSGKVLNLNSGRKQENLAVNLTDQWWCMPKGKEVEYAQRYLGVHHIVDSRKDDGRYDGLLKLTPGKHRVRVALICDSWSANQDIGSVPSVIRAVTNTVEVEIVAEESGSDRAEAVGALMTLTLHRPRETPGVNRGNTESRAQTEEFDRARHTTTS